MAELTDVQRDLQTLEAELKRLEAEYNMFFSGRLPRPPWETRGRVEALVKRCDRGYIRTPAIASASRRCSRGSRRSSTCGIAACARAKKGARARSRSRRRERRPKKPDAGGAQVLHVTAFRDPMREMDKLHALYDSLAGRAPRGRRGRRAVPQVRGAGEESGDEAARERQSGSRVSRGGEGREGELYGAGDEGREGSEVTEWRMADGGTTGDRERRAPPAPFGELAGSW